MFQKWFQSRCNSSTRLNVFRVLALAGTFLSLGGLTIAQAQANIPPLLQKVETKYSRSRTLSAHFTQTQFTSITSSSKISSGKLFVKRPSKVRWETESPDANLLIGNGTTYWFYTPPFDETEKGQVIEKPAKEVQSHLAHALIAGRFSMAKDMKIQKKGEHSFLLTPRADTAGTVASAIIEIEPKTLFIQKVTLNHKGGNKAEISLSHIQLGEPLKDTLFKFTIPKNTDRIRE